MFESIKPTKKRVLAKRDDNSMIGNMYIPEQYRDKNQFSTVLAVGRDVDEIKVGDKIVTKKFYGEGMAIADNFFIILEEDILAYISQADG